MQYTDFTKAVQRGAIAPCFALIGKEGFLRQQGLALLRERILDVQTSDLNSDTFRADELEDLLPLVQRALTYPMLGERRLIILRNAEALKKHDLSPLVEYLENPNEKTCLVLEGQTLDRRTALGRLTMAGRVECKRYSRRGIRNWMREEAARRGCAIEDQAIGLLIDLIGKNLMLLHSELEKLTLLVGEGGSIAVNHVEALIAQTRETPLYDLADAVGDRSQETALSHLNALLTDGVKATLLLYTLKQRFRKLQKARALQRSGKRSDAMASGLKVPVFVAKKLTEQLEHYSLADLDRAFRVLEEAERNLKSTQVPPQILLEKTVRSLCGKAKRSH